MQKDNSTKFIPGKTRIKYGGAVVDKEEIKAINKVLKRNWWTLDEEGRLFEQELAKTSDVKYSVFVNSGSSALLLAFSVLDLEVKSEVIVPAVNFPTAVNAILINGYTPVFIDVDSTDYCLDLDVVKKAVSKNTKAILCVNIAGSVPDMRKLKKIARDNNLYLILDNCDGYGSKFELKPVEAWADISATSFMAAHIITTGEGGALFTDNEQFYKRAVSMREWGRALDSNEGVNDPSGELPSDYQSRYTYITRGFNFRPIELQAAMGRVQLNKLEGIVKSRKQNFDRLYEGLKQFSKYLSLPKEHPQASVSWFSFPITLNNGINRKSLLHFLESRNIETRVIFAGNILKQPAYKNINHKIIGELKNTDNILHNSFFISTHPTVTEEMIEYMIQSFKEFFDSAS